MKKAPRSEQFGKPVRTPPVDGGDRTEDPLNPAIPRAPLLPHDLHRMANAALPKWSTPPSDKAGERQPLASQVDLEFLREHVDADPPPGATPSTYESAARAPHTDSIPYPSDADQVTSEVAHRLAPPAAADPVIGSGPAIITSPDATPLPSPARSRTIWPIVVAVVAFAAAGGLWWLLL
jgi:hypothetical protein